jgi:hypothetical protein
LATEKEAVAAGSVEYPWIASSEPVAELLESVSTYRDEQVRSDPES